MNRYISSFFISAFIYTIAFVSVLYFLTKANVNAGEIPKKSVQSIQFSIINPEPEKKLIEPKPKPIQKPIQKPKPKPITKPKPKPKPEPKIKPEPIPEPIPEPEVKPEPEPKPEVEHINEKPITQADSTNITNNKETKDTKYVADEHKKAKQNLFIADLRKLINQNKSYPNSARRRAIEGTVKVSFNILSDGNVKHIKVVSGKSIFKKSAIQAIERSFPLKIDKELFSFPKEFKVTLIYTLKS